MDQTAAQDSASQRPRADSEPLDRRRLVWGALAAGAAAAAASAVPEPAVAANGGAVILGHSNAASATTKVTTTAGIGLQARSTASAGTGVRGDAPAGYGIIGTSSAAGKPAVYGNNNTTSTQGGFGVRGIVAHGEGVRGDSPDSEGKGVSGHNTASSGGIGTYGLSTSFNGFGVYGDSTGIYGTGVFGRGTTAVQGTSTSSNGHGVIGEGYVGLYGRSTVTGGFGVWASGPSDGSGHALYVQGKSSMLGDLEVTGNLSKPAGSFKIDHPLDPANKYLYHSFVESPDMKNIYDGVVELDRDGTATIELPDWFEALNSDYRYQLTAVGAPAPELHIASKISGGSFTIAGGPPGLEVSWQVTGIRQDTWAKAHRIPVEEDKPADERGTHLSADGVNGANQAPH